MGRRSAALGGVLVLVLVVGCQWFNSPGYYAEDGTYHPPKDGIFTLTGKAAKDSGLPWGGIIGSVLGAIGAGGGALIHRDKTKKSKEHIRMIGRMKTELQGAMAEPEFNKLLLSLAPPDTKFGAFLQKLHAKMKAKGEPTK